MYFYPMHKFPILLLMFTFLFFRCTDDEYPVTDAPEWEPVAEWFVTQAPLWQSETGTPCSTLPEWKINLKENDASPQWNAPDQNLYPGSMTAIFRLTPFLEKDISFDDKIAAFIGDDCRGVSSPTEIDGKYYFFLQITAEADEQGDVNFKYYSKHNSKIYTAADKVSYRIDKIYGTSQAPVYPDFESSGKYPFYMNVWLRPNPDLLPFAVQQSDMIVAFVNGECRGSATLQPVGTAFSLEIRGIQAGENITVKYYSSTEKKIYQAEEKFTLNHKSQNGTETISVKFRVIPENGIVVYIFIPEVFSAYVSDKDMTSVFSGNKCRGIFSEKFTLNGKNVYRIPARILPDEKAEFRYYNDKLKYIFTSENNTPYQTISSLENSKVPLEAPLTITENHPMKMNAVMELRHEQLKKISETDIVAAFVNDECRGMGTMVEIDGKKLFEIQINGSLGVKEKVIIKYYNSTLRHKFESVKTFDFEPEKLLGNRNAPVDIELKMSKN